MPTATQKAAQSLVAAALTSSPTSSATMSTLRSPTTRSVAAASSKKVVVGSSSSKDNNIEAHYENGDFDNQSIYPSSNGSPAELAAVDSTMTGPDEMLTNGTVLPAELRRKRGRPKGSKSAKVYTYI